MTTDRTVKAMNGLLARLSQMIFQASVGPTAHSNGRIGAPRTDLSRHPLLVAAGDCAIAWAAYLVAFLLRTWLPLPFTAELMPSNRFLQVRHYTWLVLGLQPVLLFLLDAYHEIRFKGVREFGRAAAAACGIQVLVLIAVYFYAGNLTFPRTIFPIYWLLNTSGVVAWRIAIKNLSTRRKRRALIVGSSTLAEQLTVELERAPEFGLEVVGTVSDELPEGEFVGRNRILGRPSQISDLARLYEIEEVILTPEASWKDQLVDSISRLESSHVRISIVPSIYEILIGRIKHFNVHDIPLIEVRADPNDPVTALTRRLRDIVLSLIFSTVLLPLWTIVALAIKLLYGGPVLYFQNRVGQWGRVFRVCKFRTMPVGAEDGTGPVIALKDDPRVTRLGRILRSYRIDESLQLFNVLKGEMSLVGPRPDRPEFVGRHAKEIPGYNERHRIKPGLTGLAQIRGHYHSDPVIKLKYDLAYIYNYSFLLDLIILLETVRVVFRRQGV